MEKVAEIVDLINDGEWHELNNLISNSKIGYEKLESILNFLEKFGFICFDRKSNRIKLSEGFHKLLKEVSLVKPTLKTGEHS